MKIEEKRLRGWSWELREFTLVLMGCFCNVHLSEILQEGGRNSQQIVEGKFKVMKLSIRLHLINEEIPLGKLGFCSSKYSATCINEWGRRARQSKADKGNSV